MELKKHFKEGNEVSSKVEWNDEPKGREVHERMMRFWMAKMYILYLVVQFSHLLMFNSLRPHVLQHARLPGLTPTPGACSNSCTLSQWCHPTISSSTIRFSSCLHSSQHQGLFQLVSSLHQVSKVLELQLQHLPCQWIFRIDFLWDWLVWSHCSPRNSQESPPTPQFVNINSLVLRLLYGPTLTSVHDYWRNHSFNCTNLCWQSNVSAF